MICSAGRWATPPCGEEGIRFRALLGRIRTDHTVLFASVPLVFCVSAMEIWGGHFALFLVAVKVLATGCVFEQRVRDFKAWIASHCEEDPYQKFLAVLSSAPRGSLRTCFSAQLDVFAAMAGRALHRWLAAGVEPVSASVTSSLHALLFDLPGHMAVGLAVAVMLQMWTGWRQMTAVRDLDPWGHASSRLWRHRLLRLQPALEYCHAYVLASTCGRLAQEASAHIPKLLQVEFVDVYDLPVFIEKRVVEGALLVWFAAAWLTRNLEPPGCPELQHGDLMWAVLCFGVGALGILYGLLAWRPRRPVSYCVCLVVLDVAVLLLATVVLVVSFVRVLAHHCDTYPSSTITVV